MYCGAAEKAELGTFFVFASASALNSSEKLVSKTTTLCNTLISGTSDPSLVGSCRYFENASSATFLMPLCDSVFAYFDTHSARINNKDSEKEVVKKTSIASSAITNK